jgi:hypothetical protein
MSSQPARTGSGRARSTLLAALVVVSGALVGVVGHRSSAASSSSSLPSSAPSSSSTTGLVDAEQLAPRQPDDLPGDSHGALGDADGVVPRGVTVFDDRHPAVAKLAPSLLGALRQAATDAAGYGVAMYVDSGWRSRAYQEQLLREAIAKYGSAKAAVRWVATPETSAHVSGDAVDIGPFHATAWLAEHGARYGLCQIYRNEPWHYELRPNAVGHTCPAMYADPTHDPRMQR